MEIQHRIRFQVVNLHSRISFDIANSQSRFEHSAQNAGVNLMLNKLPTIKPRI